MTCWKIFRMRRNIPSSSEIEKKWVRHTSVWARSIQRLTFVGRCCVRRQWENTYDTEVSCSVVAPCSVSFVLSKCISRETRVRETFQWTITEQTTQLHKTPSLGSGKSVEYSDDGNGLITRVIWSGHLVYLSPYPAVRALYVSACTTLWRMHKYEISAKHIVHGTFAMEFSIDISIQSICLHTRHMPIHAQLHHLCVD